MAFKLHILLASLAVLKGGFASVPVVAPAPILADATIDPNPSYSFAYDVQDALTGDSKSQVESRANGVVKGQYTVADPDGTRRIVDYYADPIHGFNAVVRKAPLVAPARVLAPAPVVAPAPLVARAPYVAPAPVITRAPFAVPAPLLAPGVARLAAPYAVAPASPLAFAPRVAGVAPAQLGVAPGFSPLAAPLVGAPAPLARFASPYAW